MSKVKVVTVVGTRPEVIRLSRLIPLLDEQTHHILVHTGQNFDPRLNDIFFEELALRAPDIQLRSSFTSFATGMSSVLIGIEEVLLRERPDAFLILGDTNSALSSIIAKKLKIPIFHIEAGNRAFDNNVPEEINRRLIDGISDFNLTYSPHSSENLVREGFDPRRIFEVGSPMPEVISSFMPQVAKSDALERMGLVKDQFFVASFHRQETVDQEKRLREVVDSLDALSQEWGIPTIVSTHPRTKQRLQEAGGLVPSSLIFADPFGYFDFLSLQTNSKCVISDSGSLSEEAAWLRFPAVTIRSSIERPEALDSGTVVMAGLGMHSLSRAVRFATSGVASHRPTGYEVEDFSRRVLSIILSTSHLHRTWLGLDT